MGRLETFQTSLAPSLSGGSSSPPSTATGIQWSRDVRCLEITGWTRVSQSCGAGTLERMVLDKRIATSSGIYSVCAGCGVFVGSYDPLQGLG